MATTVYNLFFEDFLLYFGVSLLRRRMQGGKVALVLLFVVIINWSSHSPVTRVASYVMLLELFKR